MSQNVKIDTVTSCQDEVRGFDFDSGTVLRKYGCHPVKKKFRLPNWAKSPLPPSPARGGGWEGTSPLRPNRRDHPWHALHEFAERRAARFQILELIRRRTRGRQQHDALIVRR